MNLPWRTFPGLLAILLICSCGTGGGDSGDSSRAGEPRPDGGGGAGQSAAKSIPEGRLSVGETWARPAAEGMTGGVYLTVYNRTGEADTLTGTESEAATRTDIHESFSDEGITGMRVAGPLPVPAGSELALEPGGYHIMLMRMNRNMREGDSLMLRLHFASGDTLRVSVPVRLDRDR